MLWGRALMDGLIFSVLFGLMITIIEMINPRYELHNYPPEIRKTVPPKTPEEQKAFKRMALPMMVFLFAYLVWTGVQAYSGRQAGFPVLFIHYFVIIFTWNIFDLVVMDWLIFCAITPKFLVIPGTEGHPAYKDYSFHLRGITGRGLLYALAGAAAVAGIAFIWLRLIPAG